MVKEPGGPKNPYEDYFASKKEITTKAIASGIEIPSVYLESDDPDYFLELDSSIDELMDDDLERDEACECLGIPIADIDAMDLVETLIFIDELWKLDNKAKAKDEMELLFGAILLSANLTSDEKLKRLAFVNDLLKSTAGEIEITQEKVDELCKKAETSKTNRMALMRTPKELELYLYNSFSEREDEVDDDAICELVEVALEMVLIRMAQQKRKETTGSDSTDPDAEEQYKAYLQEAQKLADCIGMAKPEFEHFLETVANTLDNYGYTTVL